MTDGKEGREFAGAVGIGPEFFELSKEDQEAALQPLVDAMLAKREALIARHEGGEAPFERDGGLQSDVGVEGGPEST